VAIYYDVTYTNGHVHLLEGACFGSLQSEKGYVEMEDLPAGCEPETITYYPNNHHDGVLDESTKLVFCEWIKDHSFFGLAIREVKTVDNDVVIEVRCDVPADLMMATLNIARTLFDRQKEAKTLKVISLYNATQDLDLAVVLGDCCRDSFERDVVNDEVFQWIEESCVVPWTIHSLMLWLRNPTMNGLGIEDDFSESLSYASVKTALAGGDIKWADASACIKIPALLDFLRYEGFIS
jgi:hypothetical protein